MGEHRVTDIIRRPEDCDEEDEFRQYVEEGREMNRELTAEEANYLYLFIK